MGQKTHPTGFRLGIIKTWSSQGNRKNYAKWLHEDPVRGVHQEEAELGRRQRRYIETERAANKAKINIHTERPGIITARAARVSRRSRRKSRPSRRTRCSRTSPSPQEVETNAQLVAENIATQLERRIAFRRAMKKATQTAMKFGAKGIKVAWSPRRRRGQSRVARRRRGAARHAPRRHRVRLHVEAHTTYGSIGVKAGLPRRRLPAPRRSRRCRTATPPLAPRESLRR